MPTLRSYTLGFALSILLTLVAFGAVWLHIYTGHHFPTHTEAKVLFVVFAVLQLAVQLIFFLHIGKEQKTHWNAAVLGFALFVVTVVVGGTLWIMHNVQHNLDQQVPFINNTVRPDNED